MVGCSAQIVPEFNLVRHISSKLAITDLRRLGFEIIQILLRSYSQSPAVLLFRLCLPTRYLPASPDILATRKTSFFDISRSHFLSPHNPFRHSDGPRLIRPCSRSIPLFRARIYKDYSSTAPRCSKVNKVDHLHATSRWERESDVVLIICYFVRYIIHNTSQAWMELVC